MTWPTKKPPSGIPARGSGIGGPASGKAAQAFTDTNQPSGEEKQAGREVAREVRELIAAKRHTLVKRLLDLAEKGETDSVRLQATNAALDRLMGKPAQAVDVTTKGHALSQTVDRPEKETREQWLERRKREIGAAALMGAAAGTAD